MSNKETKKVNVHQIQVYFTVDNDGKPIVEHINLPQVLDGEGASLEVNLLVLLNVLKRVTSGRMSYASKAEKTAISNNLNYIFSEMLLDTGINTTEDKDTLEAAIRLIDGLSVYGEIDYQEIGKLDDNELWSRLAIAAGNYRAMKSKDKN